MAEIRVLLDRAAPRPPHALDMAAVRARARRRLVRRLVACATGFGVAVAAVPFGTGVLVNADRGASRVRVVAPKPAPEEASATTTTPLPTVRGERAKDNHSAKLGPALPVGRTSTTIAARADYPRASECEIDSKGLDAGESRSCRFTATRPGGWDAYQPTPHPPTVTQAPSVEVHIIRGAESHVYFGSPAGEGGPNCANAVVEPGDFVEVTIRQPPANDYPDLPYETHAGAGEGWGCA